MFTKAILYTHVQHQLKIFITYLKALQKLNTVISWQFQGLFISIIHISYEPYLGKLII